MAPLARLWPLRALPGGQCLARAALPAWAPAARWAALALARAPFGGAARSSRPAGLRPLRGRFFAPPRRALGCHSQGPPGKGQAERPLAALALLPCLRQTVGKPPKGA